VASGWPYAAAPSESRVQYRDGRRPHLSPPVVRYGIDFLCELRFGAWNRLSARQCSFCVETYQSRRRNGHGEGCADRGDGFLECRRRRVHDWYDTEHIPSGKRVPGFLTLQRWIGAENPKQSVATYDLDSLAVLQSSGYRAIGGETCRRGRSG